MACWPLRTFSSDGAPGMYCAGVSGGEIEPRVRQAGIEVPWLLEVFDGDVELAGLVCLDALVEQVAGFQLVAAGRDGERGNKHDEREATAGLALHPVLLDIQAVSRLG